MIDDNISMEEDTELRELVVQTLENNGVLSKVRAELRASVFLTLEEQESVLNPEPFLNKSVKQYLASSEGKLLFSLVREFLEYFGLNYTISVYDPETYYGKEYNYVDRKKLCEEFGIDSKEPLLGELLKNIINSALNNSQKTTNDSYNDESHKINKITENLANTTFDVSVPTIVQKDSISDGNITSDKLESVDVSNLEMPINVTITKKQNEHSVNNKIINSPNYEVFQSLPDKVDTNSENCKEQSNSLKNPTNQSDIADEINSGTNYLTNQLEVHLNKETCQNKKSLKEFQTTNNVKNKKQVELINKSGKTVYFDEIIVDGVKEKLADGQDNKLELPPLPTANNLIFGDLPPLNDKKANINDLKELMNIAQDVSQYEEDFTSSTSGSVSEQSPLKVPFTSKSPETYINKQGSVQNIQSENESEEIDEEIPSTTSCLENLREKNTENLPVTATKD